MCSAAMKVQRQGKVQAPWYMLLCRMPELWLFKMSQLLKEDTNFFSTTTGKLSTSLPVRYSLEIRGEGLFLESLSIYVA